MTNVLVAIDEPLYGKATADLIANHRWAPGTNFKLIHALTPKTGIYHYFESHTTAGEFKQEVSLLKEISERIQQALPDMSTSIDVRHGVAREVILTEASNWPADLIVMGSRGHRGMQMSSVSLSILMHAPCSVLVVHLPNRSNAEETTSQVRADAREKTCKTPLLF